MKSVTKKKKKKKKNKKKTIRLKRCKSVGGAGAPKPEVDVNCYIDFLISHMQSILTYEVADGLEIEGLEIEEKSIYDFLIKYVNESEIYLEDGSKLVLIQQEIDKDEITFESYNTLLTNNIIKVNGNIENITLRQIEHMKENEGEGTHYVVKEKKSRNIEVVEELSHGDNFFDPYITWQNDGTDGYCQMYSFFGAIGNDYEIDNDKTTLMNILQRPFADYEYGTNNYICTRKTIELIRLMHDDEDFECFTKDILNIMWNDYVFEIGGEGFIPSNIFTIDELFNQLLSITEHDWNRYEEEEDIPSILIRPGDYDELNKIVLLFEKGNRKHYKIPEQFL